MNEGCACSPTLDFKLRISPCFRERAVICFDADNFKIWVKKKIIILLLSSVNTGYKSYFDLQIFPNFY